MENNNEITPKMETKYSCDLWIVTDNDSPDVVTEITGISPTHIERKGEPVYHRMAGDIVSGALSKKNIWRYSLSFADDESGWDLIYAADKILGMIEQNRIAFMEVFNRYEEKHLSFYEDLPDYNISFRIQPEVWQRIAPYNFIVDFDLNGVSVDEEE